MATVALDVFLPQISTKVMGCPDPVVRDALVRAAAEFCTRSECWHELQAAASVTSANFPYSIPVAAHARVIRLLAAKVDGSTITETSYGALDSVEDWDTETDTPAHYLFNSSDKLIVYPLPIAAVSLRLRVVYTVARAATVLEDFLYTRWLEEIASGAVAKLVSEPNKVWSNPDQYAFHKAIFERGVVAARIESRRNLTTADMCVAMRPAA